MTGISLFFPMYNELGTVERMVDEALAVLPALADDYELLIVDDASSDGSAQAAAELARRHPRVRVIHHPHNRGYGAALRTGFENAAQELVFYTDCDEPVDLWEIERALALIGPQVDIVVGYRVKRYDTLRRFVYSKIYNALCRLLFRIPVRDVNFSFKLVKREVLQRINLRAGSVFIDGELLAEAVRYGYRIVEIPIEYFPRRDGTSNFDSLHAAFYTLQEMLTYWWRSRVRHLP